MLRPSEFGLQVAAMLFASAITAISVATASAQERSPVDGRTLVARICSDCHATGPGDRGAKNDTAPTFSAIAGMASTTELSIKVFLRTPHANMPNIMLSEDEAGAIAGFILGLRTK